MRQLMIQAPAGRGQEVLAIAEQHQGANLVCLQASDGSEPTELLFVHISNDRVESLLEALDEVPALRLTLPPQGVIVLKPPADQAPEQAKDVGHLSPIEVFLSGLQSIGGWQGFLGYAFFASFVVWSGLLTGTIYLLVAAMLLAPFAGPAMNLAIGTARGDGMLIRQTLLRYFAALAVTVGVCALLTLLFRQQTPTPLMIETSNISATAVLLPLVAGAAGALHLVLSQRNSLVSGAAVGVLVAASLAPPAGVVGVAGALGRWDLVQAGLFLLLLQLVGINLAGALVFRLYGLGPEGVRYTRGRRSLSLASFGVTLVALAALLVWQFDDRPNLLRATRSTRAEGVVYRVMEAHEQAELVEVDMRFTRAAIAGQNTLLGVVYVQPRASAGVNAEQLRRELTQTLQQALLAQGFNATPLLNVVVLTPPSGP